MSKKTKGLNRPVAKVVTAPPGTYQPSPDQPLNVERVTGKNWPALFVNLTSLTAVFFAVFLIIKMIGYVSDFNLAWLSWALSIAASVIFLVFTLNRMWVAPAARQAVAFIDNLFGGENEIMVFLQGLHFVTWWSSRQVDNIDFQKHEDAGEDVIDGKPCRVKYTFPTSDGSVFMEADVTTFFNRRDSKEALGKSLKYQLPELKLRVRAEIAGALSDIGGCNTYEDILRFKAEVKQMISMQFGKIDETSPFERETGLSIVPPILNELTLAKESKEILSTRSKISVIDEGIKKLRRHGLTAEEAAVTARVAEKASTEHISTHRGIPSGAQFVAVGETGLAIAARTGGK